MMPPADRNAAQPAPGFDSQLLRAPPNRFDLALLPIILAVIVMVAFAAQQMNAPFRPDQPLAVHLDVAYLPYYLMRTSIRMLAALVASLLFSLAFAALASKSRTAEKVLVPALDILQSIPVLGFLSITVTGFIALFPGNLAGVECAAIFAIFTSQAWNMAFSLYQSFRTIPGDLLEAAAMFRLSPWQRFWRLEVPYAMPGLLWNMMMSMSGGWFFVVASEAISVSGHDIRLPGIGSYIALAIQQQDLAAIGWAILAMLVGILLCDQLLFRPLVAWADRFRFETLAQDKLPQSWLLDLLRRSAWVGALLAQAAALASRTLAWGARTGAPAPARPADPRRALWLGRMRDAAIVLVALAALVRVGYFVHSEVGWAEVVHVLWLGTLTMARVIVLIALAALVWVPIGIRIGLNPDLARIAQPIAQFLAAFPANLMFPLAVMLIARFGLNPEIWLSPLLIFGTQWYILFNVIAGASGIPTELKLAARNFGLRGWLLWKRFLIPAVFPSLLTGLVTAAGGSWNASIVSEYVTWGDRTIVATGLGSYIAETTARGDFPRIALGIGVMALFVVGFNRLLWNRLYQLAQERTRL
ncbi:putative Binding-protein-dependent transporter, inner membrane component [Cupriavidus taiwanensis]|uniref:Binding-protein-dependent transporter, inner membrane component n=1 Tax=Cupriavidus taiwanensis TaxID=164546 RepID=A0A375E2I6_9BURK|nr:ABC transporter permease subunit [Cupriavidus taiwanensis]SOZ57477.1 putative Binding-protein-dependent transporter, inner membrane component [Cupriavidus taiwanensis]SOZ58151.1 putative Binding-protein-dependent transporter, inner membrane component [Cupriavidus taiwanensis]SOZ61059.1 putative Binding-protein-dependent transporter, inner membrane component [Cupriavidus taiwanensis]SPA05940.1 putative Binding-protein-dependent transporter, inner membrane component [Cupriavidus taiwanensis]